jgi:transcriptional activator SPT8
MEDIDDADADADADDGDGDGDDGDDGEGDEDGDQDDDDQDEPDSPSQSQRPRGSLPNGHGTPRPSRTGTNPSVVLTSPSPRSASLTGIGSLPFRPSIRPEALTASVYDIIPTIATPHSTSINSITATPDMRWIFSGGADGYIRKFNWVDTANGKLALTVAQRHPFVDSVTKAGVLLSYWENEDGMPLYELIMRPTAVLTIPRSKDRFQSLPRVLACRTASVTMASIWGRVRGHKFTIGPP